VDANTVDELVYQHEVILDRFFVYLAEIRLADVNKSVAELEDQRSISVVPVKVSMMTAEWEDPGNVLGHRNNIETVYADVKEASRPKCDDGRPDVAVRDDLNPKDVRY
jgi:hypothetical protein